MHHIIPVHLSSFIPRWGYDNNTTWSGFLTNTKISRSCWFFIYMHAIIVTYSRTPISWSSTSCQLTMSVGWRQWNRMLYIVIENKIFQTKFKWSWYCDGLIITVVIDRGSTIITNANLTHTHWPFIIFDIFKNPNQVDSSWILYFAWSKKSITNHSSFESRNWLYIEMIARIFSN